ncbi:MAG: aconitate hydratase AcnA [Coriobacteriales bacterium]|nr:aconitate hydratase AcnA [Coriobacteriales bacterium]
MTQDTKIRTATLSIDNNTYCYYPVDQCEGASRLPYALKILLENVLRYQDSQHANTEQAQAVLTAGLKGETGEEVSYMPARVLFQDFTGVPVMVDFAAMRDAVQDLGGDPRVINPLIPCDLVIDHSVIGDVSGCKEACAQNEAIEFDRNRERYTFLKWAQDSFDNLRILPPAAGICHQLNIELLAKGVTTVSCGYCCQDTKSCLCFDTVVGTDSHTTTAAGLGVLAWGVGGIEAEAAALGQPISILVPKTYGIHMTGALQNGVSAMDLALTVAQILRSKNVVGAFVEAFGEGVSSLSATQRTCVSNMSPEYGCTAFLFPVDERTLEYYRNTGRSAKQISLIETYCKTQGFWHDPSQTQVYHEVIELDLSTVEHSIAGPSRPHDRIPFDSAHNRVREVIAEHGHTLQDMVCQVEIDGSTYNLTHGALAIAAITSCTTTADPSMMLAAGLLARNAAAAGVFTKPWVKRLLSPGSHASELLLERAGLLKSLQEQGFYTAGFGCMSCIGNSGPILPQLHELSQTLDLAAVVSGNRNFEGRISPDVSQNYLGSPATVVAYALAGTVDFDFVDEPLINKDGKEVFLRDLWPLDSEISELMQTYVNESLYTAALQDIEKGSSAWQNLSSKPSLTYDWDEKSTYIAKPPYFEGMSKELSASARIANAKALVFLGDFVTTDHISPAGQIAAQSPAALYLESCGLAQKDFNTYGSRRGNHKVMQRGTYANVKLQNRLVPEKRGCWTYDQIRSTVTSVWDAAVDYMDHNIPLVVVAGQMYGSGSSRDWAAKGVLLQGVKAVFAQSFERIHRSNLVGMGILPLEFPRDVNADTLGLTGHETFTLPPLDYASGICPKTIPVTVTREDESTFTFEATVRIDTPTELAYMAHGGILQYTIRKLMA